jgi:hypothetical protein
LNSEIIKPNEEALIKLLNTRGKYFSVSDTGGVKRLSRSFALSEDDVRKALRASDFVFVIKIPTRAYWIRKEALPEGPGPDRNEKAPA